MKFKRMKHWWSFALCLMVVAATIMNPLSVKAVGNNLLPSGTDSIEVGNLINRMIDGTEDVPATEVVGGAIRISMDGNDIYTRDFGYADKENDVLISSDTVFEWGTASQLLIWVSALQLAEDESIDMQTEISTYLPEGNLKEALTGTGITMDNLMNYSSGYQDNLSEKIIPEGASYSSLAESLENNIPKHIYGAGSVVSVSDWPAALAAYVIECVSGEEYAEYVKNNIFIPLGMDYTAMLPDLSDNEAVMNGRKEIKSYQGENALTNSFYHMPLYPAGMVTGTIDDFHRFACELLVQDSTSKLFDKKETAETLFHTTLCYTGSEEPRVAHGMIVYRLGTLVYGIDGNSASQSALVFMEPDSKTCLTYMANQHNENQLGSALAELVFGSYEVEKISEISGLRVYEGTYVAGNATVDGKETFYSIMSAMFFTLGENNTLVLPMFGNTAMFEIIDEDHVVMNNGSIGNIYAYPDGTTMIMMPVQDYVSYSSLTYFLQIIIFIAMLAGYFYASLVVIIAVLGFIIRKFSKEKLEPDKFRKYHYIQCLNITLFSLTFAFMAMMVMSYSPVASVSATSMMYWLGSIMSLIYLLFFWKTGRKEEVSKKNKILYWTTAVFSAVLVVFAMMFGLIL